MDINAEYHRNYYDNVRRAAGTHGWLRGAALVAELKSVPCVDCGRKYPSCVMDLDHRDPAVKFRNVSRMYSYSPSRIRAEVAKCDVVCANCHRLREHNRTHSHAPLG